MLRTIAAAVVGYFVLAVLILSLFTGLWQVLGDEGAFRPGTYEASRSWIGATIVLGFLAAMAGGWVASRIARGARGAKALAVLTLVLGVAFAVPVLRKADAPAEARPSGEVSMAEAMSKARQPVWVALLNPVIGAAGALLGGRRRG